MAGIQDIKSRKCPSRVCFKLNIKFPVCDPKHIFEGPWVEFCMPETTYFKEILTLGVFFVVLWDQM
jgi:hypothetical protein